VVFGWQFRPVLGADYVKSGQRQVFAQLALPARLMEDYIPTVYVQTRWREYDPKRQVVGEAYKNSCTVDTDRSGVTLLSPLVIRQMNVTDIGNGQVRLTAKGTFFASGMSVRSGPNNVAPTTFDGTTIETFASIHDVLQAGDLSLVAQNGLKQPFAIVTDPGKATQCGITEAAMTAIPHPDGSAHVHLHLSLGSKYLLDDSADGPPQPFVLIGAQIYGNQENPFMSSSGCHPNSNILLGPQCDYYFVAQNTSLKNAQSFLVQDIAWDFLKRRGTIQFAPAFDKLTISSTYSTSAGGADVATPKDIDTFFIVSGFDFNKMDTSPICTNRQKPYCLRMYVGNEIKTGPAIAPVPADPLVQVASDNTATFLLSAGDLGKAKAVRFQIADNSPSPSTPDPEAVEWDLAVPKAEDSTKVSVSPTYLYKGDSQTAKVTGTGIDFTNVTDVLYDGKIYTTTPKKAADSIQLLITTEVTKTSGRKEFTIEFADDKNGKKTSPQTFSIDVTLR
jgi:hypothetical protein